MIKNTITEKQLYNKKYYQKHKKGWATYNRLHRDKLNEANKRYYAKYPWNKHYDNARNRCVHKQDSYYGRVKFFMNRSDFKELWFRDKAWLLRQPSIDRINNKGHYTFENCRFIELRSNQSEGGKLNLGKKHPLAINNPQTFKKGNIPWNKGKKNVQVGYWKNRKLTFTVWNKGKKKGV